MRIILLAALLALSTAAAAQTFSYSTTGLINGVLSTITTTVTISPVSSGSAGRILLVDGSSSLLMAGDASKVCRAGGC